MKNKILNLTKQLALEEPKPEDFHFFEMALTHKSYFKDTNDKFELNALPDYDRLEFLGDSVLKLVLNEYIFQKYTKYRSGDLTKLSAYLLSDKTLEKIALTLKIEPFIKTGARIPSHEVLSDVLEAIFGACYISYGLVKTRKFILSLYKDLIESANDDELKENYKAALQEWAQARKLGLPEYKVTKEEGPSHKPNFEVEVLIQGKLYGRGTGTSKKDASQSAAKVAFNKINSKNGSK
jgi:ribonuclease-3